MVADQDDSHCVGPLITNVAVLLITIGVCVWGLTRITAFDGVGVQRFATIWIIGSALGIPLDLLNGETLVTELPHSANACSPCCSRTFFCTVLYFFLIVPFGGNGKPSQ